jgi:hypothetical protein
MKKSLSIIMVVVGLQVTTWLALVNVANADVNLGLRAVAQGVVFESTIMEQSDYQSNSSTGARVSSEVAFYDQTNDIWGPYNLLGSGPAVARSELFSASYGNITIDALEAQVVQIGVTAKSLLSSKAIMSYTFINNSSSIMDMYFDMSLEPINLILCGHCGVGSGAPSASYSVTFGTTGLAPDTIFSSGATFSGGIRDHLLTTSGSELGGAIYTLLRRRPGWSYIGYEFNGLNRHFDLGTLAPGGEATFVYSIILEATVGGQIVDPEVFDYLKFREWGAGAFLGDSLPGPFLSPPRVPIPGSAWLFLSGMGIFFWGKFGSRGTNRKRP